MTNEQAYQKMMEDIDLRGLSPHTKKEYEGIVKRFMNYFDKPAIELDEQDIRKFLRYLIEQRKVGNDTVNLYNAGIRFLYGVTFNRTLNYRQIPKLKQVRRLPELLTRNEIIQIFKSCTNLRDKALLMTIYGCGLRLSEASNLRVKDVDSESMRMFVNQGKGKKDRYTILSKSNLDILREYFKQYHPNNPEGYLFLTRAGTKMSLRAIQDIFQKYKKKCNINKKVSVHTIRHCFATHLMEDGVDVARIKQLLGHTHIQSTTFYLHLINFDNTLKSPLDTLMEAGEDNA